MPRSKSALRPCPVCAQTQVTVISQQRYELTQGHPLPTRLDVVSCPVCDFAYSDTPAGQEIYDYYYSEFSKYEHDATTTGGGASVTDRQRLQDTAALIATMVAKDDPVLDLGCANGGLLSAFKNLGYTRLTGVDPSPACAAATARLGVEGLTGSLFAPPVNGRKFKAVILCHVLEHIRDIQAAVDVLRDLVAPGGLLYIEVPDASRYGRCSDEPFQDFNVEHINHFTHASLNNLFGSRCFITVQQGIRDIPAVEGWIYPAIWCLLSLDAGQTHAGWCRDPALLPALDQYTAASLRHLDRINQLIAPFVKSQQPVLVWGTGQFTLRLLAQSALAECRIAGFIDGNPGHHGKHLLGIEIFSPQVLDVLDHPIIIGSMLHQHAIESLILAKCQDSRTIIKFA